VDANGVEQSREAGEKAVDHDLAVARLLVIDAVSATRLEIVPDSP